MKHVSYNKFRAKRDKTQSKKSWVNPQKHKVDGATSESLKSGERTSYQKDKQEQKSIQCYNCEKWGHLSKNYLYKKDKGATKGNDDERANLVCQDSDDFEGMVLMTAVTYEHVDRFTSA